MIKALVKVGDIAITIESEDFIGMIDYASFLGELAPRCEGRKVAFFKRTAKKDGRSFNVYGVRDIVSRETLSFGRHTDDNGGGFFIKFDADWEPPYNGGANQERAEGPGHYDQGEPGQGDDPATDEVPMNYPPPQQAAPQQRRDYTVPATRPSQGLPRPPQHAQAPAGKPRRF